MLLFPLIPQVRTKQQIWVRISFSTYRKSEYIIIIDQNFSIVVFFVCVCVFF